VVEEFWRKAASQKADFLWGGGIQCDTRLCQRPQIGTCGKIPTSVTPQNCLFSEGSGPHLIHSSLGSRESTPQTGSWSVQPFLHRDQHTHTHTDHVTPSTQQQTTLAIAVMQPNRNVSKLIAIFCSILHFGCLQMCLVNVQCSSTTWVSEQFLNGTSAHNRLFSTMKLSSPLDTMGCPTFTHKTSPSPSTIDTPSNTPILDRPHSPPYKRHLDLISRFSTVHFPDRHTDRRIDRWDKRHCVPRALTLMLYCYLFHDFTTTTTSWHWIAYYVLMCR